jgi:hypothetical protein
VLQIAPKLQKCKKKSSFPDPPPVKAPTGNHRQQLPTKLAAPPVSAYIPPASLRGARARSGKAIQPGMTVIVSFRGENLTKPGWNCYAGFKPDNQKEQ